MKIYLAADHRGFALKEKIKQWLTAWGYEYEDCGAFELNEQDDYPDFIHTASQKVSADPVNSKAIILGGSGQGEAMTANRHKGVHAAVFYGGPDKVITLSREHNDANTLALGAFFVDETAVEHVLKLWLDTPFSGDERHQRRIKKIDR